MKQLVIEGTIPKKDQEIADSANDYLAKKRRKKAAAEGEKAALETLKIKMAQRNLKSMRIFGFNIELTDDVKVHVSEIDDEQVEEAKSEKKESKEE